MIRILILFLLTLITVKQSYFFGAYYEAKILEIIGTRIPLFTIILVILINQNFRESMDEKNKIYFFLILGTFIIALLSKNTFSFLFFLEFCSFFIIFFVADSSKDWDKFTSIIFIVIFNIFGSVPFFYIFCSDLKEGLIMARTVPLAANISWMIFFFSLLLLVRKLPIFFLHFWLTKAHVRASGVCSIILAAVMLKLGRFGLIKLSLVNWQISLKFMNYLTSLRILGVLYFRILIIRFFDLKYFVACSSVAHIALSLPMVIGGRTLGLIARIMIAVGHGLVSFFLFFLVSLIYEFSHNRSFDFFKSLESFRKFFYFLFRIFFFWIWVCLLLLISSENYWLYYSYLNLL